MWLFIREMSFLIYSGSGTFSVDKREKTLYSSRFDQRTYVSIWRKILNVANGAFGRWRRKTERKSAFAILIVELLFVNVHTSVYRHFKDDEDSRGEGYTYRAFVQTPYNKFTTQMVDENIIVNLFHIIAIIASSFVPIITFYVSWSIRMRYLHVIYT